VIQQNARANGKAIMGLLAQLVKPVFWTRPFADRTLCHFLRRRLSLPTISLADLFEGFDREIVNICQVPRGGWSTPLADLVMLLKLTVCVKPKRLMEIGSFRGYTALLLAQHTSEEARIVTVDRNPEHGEAYCCTPLAARIERRVGEIGPDLFASDAPGSYDLIFIDADHSYEGVRRDTTLALGLVAPTGYIVWHDYANWGYFDGKNGVPEYLKKLTEQRGLLLARVAGSDLAFHSPAWAVEGSPERAKYYKALQAASGWGHTGSIGIDQWHTALPRGVSVGE
jgi:predicted O-methyltransferase YrrM